jgi:hypothetical protein
MLTSPAKTTIPRPYRPHSTCYPTTKTIVIKTTVTTVRVTRIPGVRPASFKRPKRTRRKTELIARLPQRKTIVDEAAPENAGTAAPKTKGGPVRETGNARAIFPLASPASVNIEEVCWQSLYISDWYWHCDPVARLCMPCRHATTYYIPLIVYTKLLVEGLCVA